jgi:hypothetical protein
MVLRSDAESLSEVIEDNICNRIIELNFGQSELIHAPRFILKFDVPADRGIEIDRMQKALNAGLEIGITEAYEISGFTRPDDDEIRIRIDQPPTPAMNPTAPASRPLIVMPGESESKKFYIHSIPDTANGKSQKAIPVGESKYTTTVNEARESEGKEPIQDGDVTIAEYQKKIESENTDLNE